MVGGAGHSENTSQLTENKIEPTGSFTPGNVLPPERLGLLKVP